MRWEPLTLTALMWCGKQLWSTASLPSSKTDVFPLSFPQQISRIILCKLIPFCTRIDLSLAKPIRHVVIKRPQQPSLTNKQNDLQKLLIQRWKCDWGISLEWTMTSIDWLFETWMMTEGWSQGSIYFPDVDKTLDLMGNFPCVKWGWMYVPFLVLVQILSSNVAMILTIASSEFQATWLS
jgi:hypothetical protein